MPMGIALALMLLWLGKCLGMDSEEAKRNSHRGC
jgi:hypothetical protein